MFENYFYILLFFMFRSHPVNVLKSELDISSMTEESGGAGLIEPDPTSLMMEKEFEMLAPRLQMKQLYSLTKVRNFLPQFHLKIAKNNLFMLPFKGSCSNKKSYEDFGIESEFFIQSRWKSGIHHHDIESGQRRQPIKNVPNRKCVG